MPKEVASELANRTVVLSDSNGFVLAKPLVSKKAKTRIVTSQPMVDYAAEMIVPPQPPTPAHRAPNPAPTLIRE